MKRMFVVCLLLLTGCGDFTLDGMGEGGEIHYHVISPEEMIELTGGPHGGHAFWERGRCDVYFMPPEEYPSFLCYRGTIRHEERHCYEGHFHPVGNGPVPECTPRQ